MVHCKTIPTGIYYNTVKSEIFYVLVLIGKLRYPKIITETTRVFLNSDTGSAAESYHISAALDLAPATGRRKGAVTAPPPFLWLITQNVKIYTFCSGSSSGS
jgi:hypothetical protein